MKRIEYYTALVDWRDLDSYLDAKGLEGWELASSHQTGPPGTMYRLIFKREKLVLCNRAAECDIQECHHKTPHTKSGICGTSCDSHMRAKCLPLRR